jgi:NADPH:quinone reductase-like Zn-dependent oxidoreductase
MQAKALWHVGPGHAELREEAIGAPTPAEVRVRALFGAISRGTERLVAAGRVPPSEYGRMRAPLMGGAFPFPVKYGYSTIGRVEEGPPPWRGRNVFVLHPHQDVFIAPADLAQIVPDGVPPARAVLAANMETALNALWDGAPGPADRIAVIGGGVVGMLVARLCGQMPGAEVTMVDIAPSRADLARALGVAFATPDAAPADCDLVYHTSGSAAGLTTALKLAGEEATIVEMSWYGSDSIAAPLGEAFHSRRLRLLSSQVGKVAPSHRARWTHGRRLQAALALLKDPAFDALLAPPVAFDDLPAQLPAILNAEADARCPLIRYPAAEMAP